MSDMRDIVREAIQRSDEEWETLQRRYVRFVPPKKELRSCKCSEVDAYGRHCIGLCGPDCEGRPR